MKKIIGVLVLLALPLCANATIVDFYTDGTIESGNTYDQANIWNTAFVNMTGGSANIVEAHNSSTLQFQEGNITGWISVFDTSTFTMSGGLVDDLQLFSSGVANISGGAITGWVGTFSSTAIVNIYAKSFNNTVHNANGWIISGNWNDDNCTPFIILYRGDSPIEPGHGGSPVFLYTIPEPSTLCLLGATSLFLRKEI